MARPEETPPNRVVFGWGAAVFLCTDNVWEDILREVAENDSLRLDDMVQKRCKRLTDRGFIHLGLVDRAEAEARLAGRKQALAGTPEPPPTVIRIKGQPPRFAEK